MGNFPSFLWAIHGSQSPASHWVTGQNFFLMLKDFVNGSLSNTKKWPLTATNQTPQKPIMDSSLKTQQWLLHFLCIWYSEKHHSGAITISPVHISDEGISGVRKAHPQYCSRDKVKCGEKLPSWTVPTTLPRLPHGTKEGHTKHPRVVLGQRRPKTLSRAAQGKSCQWRELALDHPPPKQASPNLHFC